MVIPAPAHAQNGTRYAYDLLDRVTDVYECVDGNADRNTHHYDYDAVQNTVTAYDEMNYITYSTYASFGEPEDKELIQVKLDDRTGSNPDWWYVYGNTTYQYTAAGKLKEADQNGPGGTIVHTYSYDAYQYLASETHPETGTITYGHDAVGNVTSRTDSRGTVTYGYDEIARLTDIAYPDSTPGVSYSYDNADNVVNATTRVGLTAVTSTDYTYYPDNKPASKAYIYNLDTKYAYTQSYTYDNLRNLATITYPSGRVLTYTYYSGAPMRLQQITDSVTSQNIVSGIGYQPSGQPAQYAYGNGTATTLFYDGYQRMTRTFVGGAMDINYGYTACDNITSILYSNRRITLAYDGINRLCQASGPWGMLTYGYDYFDNRTSDTRSTGQTTYVYDTANRLASSSEQLSTGGVINVAYTHDAAGNMTSNGGYTFGYDLANRITTLNGTQAYWYDDKGNRIKKTTTSTGTTYYHYGPAGEVLEECDATGAPIYDYIYLAGKVIAKYVWSTGSLTYFHHDVLGNTMAQTNGTGTVGMQADYEPYGTVYTSGSPPEKRLFTGKELDETGLDYFGARYYDPTIGRFISVDPAGPDPKIPRALIGMRTAKIIRISMWIRMGDLQKK